MSLSESHIISGFGKYIESVTLNGQPLNTPFFHHQDIANGGTMEIKMTAQPTKWGVR